MIPRKLWFTRDEKKYLELTGILTSCMNRLTLTTYMGHEEKIHKNAKLTCETTTSWTQNAFTLAFECVCFKFELLVSDKSNLKFWCLCIIRKCNHTTFLHISFPKYHLTLKYVNWATFCCMNLCMNTSFMNILLLSWWIDHKF